MKNNCVLPAGNSKIVSTRILLHPMAFKIVTRTIGLGLVGFGFQQVASNNAYLHTSFKHFSYQNYSWTHHILESVHYIWSLFYGNYYHYVNRLDGTISYTNNHTPNKDSIRFVVISDTHETHNMLTIPDGDVLIHCGDILFSNSKSYDPNNEQLTIDKLNDFNEWLSKLPHKIKIVVAGNHDYCFLESVFGKEKIETLLNHCTYLVNQRYIIDPNDINNNDNNKFKDINVWASPYSIANSQ